ncbi:hypothetical protein Tco_1505019 [Tanacetum coccineum]
MKDNPQLQQQDVVIWLALQMKFKNLKVQQTTCRPSAVRLRDQDNPQNDAHPEGENSAKRQKTSEYEAYVSGESSSGQVIKEERDDDEIPSKQVSQDIIEEVSLTIDEEKLKKMADEMLRQRCTSRDEHQYHIDQMKNFLQGDIVWESIKEILVSPHPRKTTPLVQSFQRDPEAPALSLINQDLLWVNKYVKKFNPYARYGVEHWKNPHAKIFYIRKQKEPRKLKEEVYSNSNIIQVVKTYWELGHEHKFVTEIVARRANECIVSITEPDYKNLSKNDIKDMYLLIMNGKVPDYAETGLLWSLSVFIRRFEKYRMFSIIYKPVHGIIYKNNKKEKRVMRHSEIHKFCDAMLNRVLEGLKSYNNDVKYGYVQRELTNDEVEYLKLFEEEIEGASKMQTQQVAARDEKWVPFTERVKISSTNVRLETTVPQKEETFQVVIDLVKNSSCFKAFTISADVPEIFMQQFWYSIKKVQGTDSYEFLLANKKCVVNADVFRTILDICPRVEGVNFTDVPDDDTTLAFLIKLGYKGPLYKHTNMFVDHMHQPWKTLAAIINKCLSRKTASNDKLRKSRIDILLITRRKRDQGVSSITSLSNTSLSNLKYQHYHTIKDDGIVCRLKFVRIGEDYQEYRLSILKTMLTEAIKQSKSYQMFIKYSTESEPEPEPVKRKTFSKRRVKKKVTMSADDNIIFDVPDTALDEGTGTIPGVPDESTVISATSSEGTGTKPRVLDEEKKITKENVILEWGSKQESEYSEEDLLDDERGYEDEEMLKVEVEDSDKGDEEVTDAAKADAKKTLEVKDDPKKIELPPTSSSLSVSSEINSLLEVKIQSKVPHNQSSSMLSVPVSVIFEPSVLTPVRESPSIATITTLPPPSISTTPFLRVAKLEKDVSELKKIDLSAKALAALKTQVPFVVDDYLGSKVGDIFQKELKKHTSDLIQKYSLQQIPKLSKKQTQQLI